MTSLFLSARFALDLATPLVAWRDFFAGVAFLADLGARFAFAGWRSGVACRRGELLALAWADVDFTSGVLQVSKSLEQTRKGGLRVKTPKSGESRELGVPDWALAVLKIHRAEQQRDRTLFGTAYACHDLIFCQPNGQYYSPDRLGARVVELMRKVGLKGVTLHSLRHSHASILLSKGVPAAVVAERLGHADQNITLSIYSHALPADSRAAAKIWNNAVAEVVIVATEEPSRALLKAPAC